MFDKISIRASISDEESAHLAHLHRLDTFKSEDGGRIIYKSNDYSKFTGIVISITNNKLTLKTSLHKYWNKRNFGRLRNDNVFTLSEAKSAFEMLLFENGLLPERTRIVYFEIGINLNVSYPPLSFIEPVIYLPRKNEQTIDKDMFIDANYRKNRQKTTEKHKDIRKYFKIYDKGWEMKSKVRSQKPEDRSSSGFQVPGTEKYILRVETVYKRHNEKASTFFTDENIKRLVNRFMIDWKDLFFYREIRAYKGARKSEVDCALQIVNSSYEEYVNHIRAELEQGRLTPKQYRTMREFARDFEENSDKYKVIISKQEQEYKRIFMSEYGKNRQ